MGLRISKNTSALALWSSVFNLALFEGLRYSLSKHPVIFFEKLFSTTTAVNTPSFAYSSVASPPAPYAKSRIALVHVCLKLSPTISVALPLRIKHLYFFSSSTHIILKISRDTQELCSNTYSRLLSCSLKQSASSLAAPLTLLRSVFTTRSHAQVSIRLQPFWSFAWNRLALWWTQSCRRHRIWEALCCLQVVTLAKVQVKLSGEGS